MRRIFSSYIPQPFLVSSLPCHGQNGFILIELMILIAIIGVLEAIAIPSYGLYVSEAQNNACLLEVKGYSNDVLYMLNGQNDNSLPATPTINACMSITDAKGWTLETQQRITAVAKSPWNARIECDIPNGAPYRLLS